MAVERYLRARRNDFATTTRRETRILLYGIIREIGPEKPIAKLNASHVQSWMAGLDKAPSTIRMRLSAFRTFCEWCVVNGYMKQNPCLGVKGPRQPVSMPREFEREAVRTLFRVVPNRRGELIVSLAVMEGLRRAEIAHLRREDISQDDRLMLVYGKGGKERWLPITNDTWQLMCAYFREVPGRTGPLIRSETYPNRGLSPNSVGRMVAQWMKEAGIKDSPFDGKSAHALRHTMAGAMLDDGADIRDVQHALGHASLGSTYVYLRRREATTRLRETMGARSYRDGTSDVA